MQTQYRGDKMKRVVNKVNEDFVSINDVDESKIYAFRSMCNNIFKLHRIDTHECTNDVFTFLSMDDSVCWAKTFVNNRISNGKHRSMKEAIQAQTDDVFEFDNLKEFCEWCLK